MQGGVVGITFGVLGIEQVGSGRIERGVGGEPGREVGVGEKGNAEGDGIQLVRLDRLGGLVAGVAHVPDEHPLVMGTGGGEDIAGLLLEEIPAHEVEIGEGEVVEAMDEPGGEADGIAVGHAVVAVERGDAEADAIGAPDPDGGFEDFEDEPGAVLDGAAIGTGAVVGAIAEEFIQEIAIGAMDLDAIEACGEGIAGGAVEAGDDAGDFGITEFPWGDVGFFAFGSMDVVADDGDGAWGDGLDAIVEEWMTGATAVPDLEEDVTAGGMDGIGDRAPGDDLGRGVDAGFAPEGGVALHGHGGLGNDEAGAGPLNVVLGHQRGGHMMGIGTAPGEGSHDDAIGQGQGADGKGAEQIHGWRLSV